MPDDYYALLGVDPDASEEAILRAYRERVAEHHPDVSDAEDAEETVRRLNRAKDVLTDPASRSEYDSIGHERYIERSDDDERNLRDSTTRRDREADIPGGSNPRHIGGSPGGPPGWVPSLFRGGTVDSARLFGSHGEFDLRSFLRPNSSAAGRQAGPRKDHYSADQAMECPKCHGRGRFVHELDTALGRRRRVEPCERCGGEGTVDR